jgi:thiol-disulfide isomerase/thioredoxin
LFVALTVASSGQFAAAQQAPKNFAMHATPRPVAAINFVNSQGQSRSLVDFKHKVVVFNIWATWCVPCRREMPALDRLQAALGGTDFEVVALSIDHGGKDVVSKFYVDVGIHKLDMYLDNSATATRALSIFGLPTSLLIDREGREIGRVIGPAEWDSPETIEFITCVISTGKPVQSFKGSAPAPVQLCSNHTPDVPAGETRSEIQP